MKIGVDIDGVLSNFTDAYAALLTKETGFEFPKNSKEWPPVWFWERARFEREGIDPIIAKAIEKKVWAENILHEGSTFWEDLQLFDLFRTRYAIKHLSLLGRKGHEVYFLTHRMGYNAKHQTERWLFNNGMNMPTVILSGDKIPLIRSLKLDFFIDDKLETVHELYETAEKEGWLTGKHYFLQDAPYNREGRRLDLLVIGSITEALEAAGLWERREANRRIDLRQQEKLVPKAITHG
jgi:hypothetical protein